ncbi:hypothetical protein AAHC03_012937 [Spirometra sp. Aus1]|nr:unnamed protein product [Spirometra erinaceieuropaei]
MRISLLSLPLTCLSIGLCITSLVLPYWNCGQFFTTCLFTIVHIIIVALICGGLGIITLVFIIDLCNTCRDSCVPGQICATYRLLFNAIGSAALMAGTLLYAVMFVKSWSFVLCLIGSMIAVFVTVISIFSSGCITGR